MELKSMLGHRRSRVERVRDRGLELAHDRRAQAGAAAAGVVGAAAAIVKARRSHGNGQGPRVHTTPGEGHPAGTGERSDRDIGGPTMPDRPSTSEATGGAPGTPPGSGFEPHT